MTTDEKPTGIAAAAILSASLGLLALAVSHLVAEFSSAGKAWVHAWGKAWMPGAQGIGPYSGKETLAFITWIGSWILLSLLLRRKNVRLLGVGVLSLIGLATATALLWPPITEQILHLLHGGHG